MTKDKNKCNCSGRKPSHPSALKNVRKNEWYKYLRVENGNLFLQHEQKGQSIQK